MDKKNISDQGKGQSYERSSEWEPAPITCPPGLVSPRMSGALTPTGVEHRCAGPNGAVPQGWGQAPPGPIRGQGLGRGQLAKDWGSPLGHVGSANGLSRMTAAAHWGACRQVQGKAEGAGVCLGHLIV